MRSLKELIDQSTFEMVPMENIFIGQIKIRGQHADSVGYQSLKLSVADKGIIQPGFGRPIEIEGRTGMRELGDGFQRWNVAKELQFSHYPMRVVDLTDNEMRELQFQLNTARVEQNAKEQRDHIKVYISKNPHLKKAEVAKVFAISAQHLSQIVSTNKLISEAAKAADDGLFSFGHAVLLSRMPEAVQRECLPMALDKMPVKEFGERLRESDKEYKTGVEAPKGPRPVLRKKDELIEQMAKSKHAEETHQDKNSVGYAQIVAQLQLIEWVLCLDAATLAAKDKGKKEKSIDALGKEQAKAREALAEVERKLEEKRAALAEVETAGIS